MKTYSEYLKIIKDREYIEDEPRRKKYAEGLKKGYMDVEAMKVSRFSFDYSVEIMGMMMQDFLEELSNLSTNIEIERSRT